MAVTGIIKIVLVNVILLWFAGDSLVVSGTFSSHHDKKFEDILFENFVDWLPLLDLAFQYGAPEAHQTLADYVNKVYYACKKDRYCNAPLELYETYKKYEELVGRSNAKEAIKSIIVKLVPKLITRFGPDVALKILLKTATHPLGYYADSAQIVLELCGYEKTGKVVGAGGNIFAGALAGFSVGGPPGAVIGGVFGFGIWGVGEIAYYEHATRLERIVKYIIK